MIYRQFVSSQRFLKANSIRHYWTPNNIDINNLKHKYNIPSEVFDVIMLQERNTVLLKNHENQLKHIDDKLTKNTELLKKIYDKLQTSVW